MFQIVHLLFRNWPQLESEMANFKFIGMRIERLKYAYLWESLNNSVNKVMS